MAVKKVAKKRPVKKAAKKRVKKKGVKKKGVKKKGAAMGTKHCFICRREIRVPQNELTTPYLKCNECRTISYNIEDTFVHSSTGSALLRVIGEALTTPDGESLEMKGGWSTDGLPPLRIRLPDGAEYGIGVEQAIDVIAEHTCSYIDTTMFSSDINGWTVDQLERVFLVALYLEDFNEFADLFIRVTDWGMMQSKMVRVSFSEGLAQEEKWKQATVNSG